MASRCTLCLPEASKLGLILDYDPSGERNRCFYQCLGKHLRVDKVEDVIDALENYMLHNRIVPVENEVSMCFILYRIRPRGGGGESHIKTIRDVPPFRVGFLDLWLVNRVTDPKNFTFVSQTGSKIRHKFEQRPTL